ncbi:MAG: LysM peptidoglycan-binding domain-containing protein [Chloroflexi bacterium]|nr:LysM peptidoglycan-binding domain-containing protein [Chloroflexota bacterium]MXX82851.1 LysM peptidoglycan-binding domain-containing protein [Chloroflexota bacterium]MYE80221.1 LysM peptidoglycan-binding domain-containing protein [Chloroflexota bacterium]
MLLVDASVAAMRQSAGWARSAWRSIWMRSCQPMNQSRAPLLLAILLAALPLLLAACFRDTSEALVDQPVARELATVTPLVEVLVIDEPVEEPAEEPAVEPTATQAPTIEPEAIDEFALSATALLAQQTQPAEVAIEPVIEATEASLPTLVPLARATIPPGEDCVHEIRVGDTLYRLSLAYGVSVDEITRASDIVNPDVVAVGQKVIIPECGTVGFIPPPTSVPTATPEPTVLEPTAAAEAEPAIAAADDSRSALIQQAQAVLLNNAQADAGFGAQAAPQTSGNSYTVQANDSLLAIALRFNTTVDVLASLNSIVNVDNLTVGQVLLLP